MVGRSSALGRIGLLTEVWECLATDPENQADEVGFFCAKALTQLARGDEPGDDGADGIVDWILDHSSSTWGEYLALLEGQERADEDRGAELEELDPSLEPDADATLQIDAQALIRLFQAGTAGDGTGSAGSRPPVASVPVRPAAQVQPDTVPPVLTMPVRPPQVWQVSTFADQATRRRPASAGPPEGRGRETRNSRPARRAGSA